MIFVPFCFLRPIATFEPLSRLYMVVRMRKSLTAFPCYESHIFH